MPTFLGVLPVIIMAVPVLSEAALAIGEELGRGASGLAYKAVLNGVTPVCAKVRVSPVAVTVRSARSQLLLAAG